MQFRNRWRRKTRNTNARNLSSVSFFPHPPSFTSFHQKFPSRFLLRLLCPCMQRYSAEKAAWRILVGRSFDRSFSRLNRAHSPRPVLNGARPWNRVRGHSSCLPRFIPAFARRAVLLFPLHPPRNRTRHNYSASFLFGLFTLFSEPSRGFVEDFESRALDRLEEATEVKRFDLEGAKRVGLDDVSASALDTRGKKKIVSISYFDAIKLATFLINRSSSMVIYIYI